MGSLEAAYNTTAQEEHEYDPTATSYANDAVQDVPAPISFEISYVTNDDPTPAPQNVVRPQTHQLHFHPLPPPTQARQQQPPAAQTHLLNPKVPGPVEYPTQPALWPTYPPQSPQPQLNPPAVYSSHRPPQYPSANPAYPTQQVQCPPQSPQMNPMGQYPVHVQTPIMTYPAQQHSPAQCPPPPAAPQPVQFGAAGGYAPVAGPPPPNPQGAAQGYPVQNEYQAQVVPLPLQTEGWKTGLFDCMHDPTNALVTFCFPCVTFGQVAEIVDNGHTSCATSGLLYGLIAAFIGVPCIMSCTYRTKLRSKYGLMETPAPDWVTHFLCECCALCQEYRELQHRGMDPAIGWMGNQQQVAMMPPMNQAMMG
ncbi:protein PLANT CADMIUM RESISTANCE 4-like [Malania oleifera]|uniref:protein PLANT CADMIUM RESISTANCE 4-like n=1 Tax=Malania oleifera TaxID=397392 RepID=UPI0025AE8E19|nr:protein PLANT CADMIUM RESISTANCE 4-like [Malania oleifera]